jgi:flap endonuclease-1
MGVQLADLFPGRPITFRLLSGRRIAIDAYNALHQFLAIIRQPDGQPLRDSQGRVTSVYSGLFYRTSRMMEAGIQPIYVFDGPPPKFKRRVIEQRIQVRTRAKRNWEEALRKGDIKEARKHAQSALRLTPEIVGNCRELLSRMGLPRVDSPTEGEAQGAVMARKGEAWAASSQDFDSLLFGSPRLVRNVTITRRRKLPNKDVYIDIEPMLIEMEEILSELGIDEKRLIMLGLLVGTDYNQGGVPGIGPKRGLQMVREHDDIDELMDEVDWEFDVDYHELYDFFSNPRSTEDYELSFETPDQTAVKELLCEEFDFSPKRVERSLSRISSAPSGKQTDLLDWG